MAARTKESFFTHVTFFGTTSAVGNSAWLATLLVQNSQVQSSHDSRKYGQVIEVHHIHAWIDREISLWCITWNQSFSLCQRTQFVLPNSFLFYLSTWAWNTPKIYSQTSNGCVGCSNFKINSTCSGAFPGVHVRHIYVSQTGFALVYLTPKVNKNWLKFYLYGRPSLKTSI